jgi:hypothetical protein
MNRYPEMEEMITSANRNGGRPMALGHLLFQGSDQTDVDRVVESSTIRYHLGHCSNCGKRIVIGSEMAKEVAGMFARKGILPKPTDPFKVRFAKMLLKHS